jgi:hypothetical protein
MTQYSRLNVDLQSRRTHVDFVPNHFGRAVVKGDILFGLHNRGDIDRETVKSICPIAYS